MSEILNLEPKVIWENFHKICQIPHPSKNEDAIQDFMMKFGQDLGLETIKDEVGNIIIKKPATPGMENRQGVIFQGHLDMVPQKNSDKDHDFDKDPIEAFIDGDWVTANGTTLGADNGMGVAAGMAVLQATNLEHGPIECLFTCDEETGMTGAFGLKPGVLNGDILINLDSEDEGELYVGCAGGVDVNINLEYSTEATPANVDAYELALTGLKGGHSGMEIILGRGNANKIMNRFLKIAADKFGLRIADINGGSLRNAIPRESFAKVVVNKGADIKAELAEFFKVVNTELAAVEPEMKFEANEIETPANVIDTKTQENLINAIYACPNGVARMSDAMEGLVETSNNLASVKFIEGKIEVCCLVRSSMDSAKYDLAESIKGAFALAGAKVEFDGAYPGWAPNMESPILKTMQNVYNKNFGKIPEIKAIHAGLECGLLGAVYPNWDMISCGPTIRFPHSPDEKVKIDTVKKFWDFLVLTLKEIPVK